VTRTTPPSAVPVPEGLVAVVRENLAEVRLGVYLVSVRLKGGRTVEPVVVNARPHFIGLAVSPALDLEPIDFQTEDVVDIVDASNWDSW
jgi:hypothetical protein